MVGRPRFDADADYLAAIGRALAEGGEFRLWSCDVASGATGETFVDALEEASGAAVAAADRRVGASALGGTWEICRRAARLVARASDAVGAYGADSFFCGQGYGFVGQSSTRPEI